MSLSARIDKLEAQAVGPGRLIVWKKCDGDPEPEHGPGDVLLVVVREGDDHGLRGGSAAKF